MRCGYYLFLILGLLSIDEYKFNLTDCVESVLDLLHNNASSKGLDLYSVIRKQCPEYVVGDAARLRQVLINLVSKL